MICCNIIVFLFIISIYKLINSVSAMDTESISGGTPATLHQIRHQIAILAKQNRSDTVILAGSGGFIGERLILTAAQVFVNDAGILRNYYYSIKADAIHWRILRGIEVEIELIYLPPEGNYDLNNIAVAKLHNNFSVSNNQYLNAINIADEAETFYGKIGVVAGCGQLLPTHRYNTTELREILSSVSGFLKYAKVRITRDNRCVIMGNMQIDTNKHFCGVMFSDNHSGEQSLGICEDDAGSPLVYQNKIVGIAGTNNANCNDTVEGHGYTKVSTYAPFIRSIIGGRPLPDTRTHYNRQHMQLVAAPAA